LGLLLPYSIRTLNLRGFPDCHHRRKVTILYTSLAGKGRPTMALIPMSLRLEAAEGSAGEEYRIYDGDVEVRNLPRREGAGRTGTWHRLTPGQLSTHVQRNTVVAQWLQRRLGWQRLLQKCVALESANDANLAESTQDHYAA
jgi:hypothetical protein